MKDMFHFLCCVRNWKHLEQYQELLLHLLSYQSKEIFVHSVLNRMILAYLKCNVTKEWWPESNDNYYLWITLKLFFL
jgi:hypothetical protein